VSNVKISTFKFKRVFNISHLVASDTRADSMKHENEEIPFRLCYDFLATVSRAVFVRITCFDKPLMRILSAEP